MKKNYFRRNKANLFFCVIYIVICYGLYKEGFINTDLKPNSFNENLLTINSIFIGFLFTALGIMVGFTGKKIIRSLDKAGYMDNYYNSIYFGLYFLIVSTLISIYGILVGAVNVNEVFVFLQQICLLGGILYFIKSIFGILTIIRYIRNEIN